MEGEDQNIPAAEHYLPDPLGQALLAYQNGHKNTTIQVLSPDAENDTLPAAYFFREWEEMPVLEQKALKMCRGSVLDVGAGAGAHSLWLQNQGLEVTALDLSAGAVKTMGLRQVQRPVLGDFFSLPPYPFDTLLLLMNGIGIVEKKSDLPTFFENCKQLLAPGGQILLDSSDIIHLYPEDIPVQLNEGQDYYGEINYQMVFNGIKGTSFTWLYADFNTLAAAANEAGFQCKKVFDADFNAYLAHLTLR